jgi:hypothetical protein
MSATIQEQIDALQAQIDATRGDVAGVTPASCNIAAMNAVIESFKDQIKVLRAAQVQDDNPFDGTTMTLRLDAKNVPSLTGINPAAVALIKAIGTSPAAIEVDGVVVSVASNTAVNVNVMPVPNVEVDVIKVAETLAAFMEKRDICIDYIQVQDTKNGNVAQANKYMELAELQSDIIDVFENANITKLSKPSMDPVTAIIDGKKVTIDFSATGTQPISFTVAWGDGTVTALATTPETHTYAKYETEYKITVTAKNTAGDVSVTKIVTTDDSSVAVSVAPVGDLDVTTTWANKQNLGVVIEGEVNSTDLVFTGSAATDFADVLTAGVPNGAFTCMGINLKGMLTEMGITGSVEVVQTNPTLNLAYPGAFPSDTKTKSYTLSSLDDEFNVLLMSGAEATLKVNQGGTLILTITIDATDLVVNA